MQPKASVLLLLGFVALTIARVLPPIASDGGSVDDKPSYDVLVVTAGEYDANNIASDGTWDKYRKEGDHYQCLFEANDEGAGRLIEDTRTPPSAQSIWKGSMYGK